MKKFISFLFLMLFYGFVTKATEIPEKFFKALGQVESAGNVKAYNKNENAIGIYQIRKLYFIDAQKFNPELKKYKHKDCFSEQISKQIVLAYFQKYGKNELKNKDWESLAKLHNGGCNWKNKTGKAKQNLEICRNKIKKELDKIDKIR